MKTLEQVRIEGFQALLDTLGPVDVLRFIQQFSNGYGDYSEERYALLDGKSLEDLIQKPKKQYWKGAAQQPVGGKT